MKIKSICSMIVASFFSQLAIAGEPQKPEIAAIMKQAEAIQNDKALKASTYANDKLKQPNLTKLTRYENAKGELVKVVKVDVRERKGGQRASSSTNKEEYFFHQGKLILVIKDVYASRTTDSQPKRQRHGVYLSFFKGGKCIKATSKSIDLTGEEDTKNALKKVAVNDEPLDGQEIYLEIAAELSSIKTQEDFMKYFFPVVQDAE